MNVRVFHMPRNQRALVRLVVVVCLLTLTGCGSSNKNSVSGKVYMGDKIVKGGTVIFVMADGSAGRGDSRIEEDGSYTVEKLPVGDFLIGVETKSMKPSATAAARPMTPPKNATPEQLEQFKKNYPDENKKLLYVPIPDSYGDPKTSGLTFTIVAGKNEFDIKLTEKNK
jgi:hypothetical protein